MASPNRHGYYDQGGQYRNDPQYLTGTPQDYLFENPYNYAIPEDQEGEEVPIDLTSSALDLSNKQFQSDPSIPEVGKRHATEDNMVTSSSNTSGETAGYDPRRGVWSPGGVLSDITDIQIKHEVIDTADALENCNLETDMVVDDGSTGGSLHPSGSPGLDSSAGSSRGASPNNATDAIDAMNAMVQQNKRRKMGNTHNKGKSLEEELCLICGDRASGYHYNALSCEGCKGFFRRSITRGSTYQCKYGGNCEMDMWMRRRCQSCRLQRCREVGMKEECLLSEEQCKARDVRRKARQSSVRTSREETQPAPDSNTPETKRETKKAQPPIINENPLEVLSAEHKELIEKIVTNQDKYELPNEDDVARLANVKIKDRDEPSELSDAIYKQMANVTIMVTQLVVEFAKHLPGFQTLNRDDQIVLLKGSSCEIMMIRTARRYDIETDTIVFADGMPYTRDNLRFAGLHGYVDSMFHYCRTMGTLAVDNAEYALMTAITLFSVRPGVKDIQKVEEIQEMYARVLESYDRARRGHGTYFAKLLMTLVELRTLSCEYSDVLFKMKVEKGSLPPLLCEYFDVE